VFLLGAHPRLLENDNVVRVDQLEGVRLGDFNGEISAYIPSDNSKAIVHGSLAIVHC
jgi:hypothetical protein